MAGTIWVRGLAAVYLIKADSNGDKVWSRTFGGPDVDWGYSVRQTTDGGYIVGGTTWLPGARHSDVYLVKTDPNGHTIWEKTFGGAGTDWGYTVQQTSDRGYIIAGKTDSRGEGNYDVYLVKADVNGNEVWSTSFGGDGLDRGDSVQQTADGGFIIVGQTDSFGAGGGDVYLIKTDSEGNEVWSKTFGGSFGDYGESVEQTADGGYILTGSTRPLSQAGGSAVYLIKTDAEGNEVWSRTFGGPDVNWGYSVQQTTDGGYIIVGNTGSFGHEEEDAIYLIRTDGAGDELWSRKFC